jgi:hypothetical protein
MRFLLLGCLIISSLLVQEGRSCFCLSTPLCTQPPNPDGAETIFVGAVTDVYPASLDAYGSLESALNRRGRGSLARARRLILRLWGPILSPDEARDIRLASSLDELRRASIMGLFPRHVRFRVWEGIEGSSGGEFELFTDVSDCGYRFERGKQYLVISWRPDKSNRWWTGACSRTAPVESEDAKRDLEVLRAWRDGWPLSPRIYGRIYDRRKGPTSGQAPPAPADFIIRLTGASSGQEVRPDAEGHFSFDNLGPTSHRLELVAAGARGSPLEIDLSHGRCFEAMVFIEEDASGVNYRILGRGAPRSDWESGVFSPPPPILPAPITVPPMFPPRQPDNR